MRLRLTVKPVGNTSEELRIATDVQQVLIRHAPVYLASDYPIEGAHTDYKGRRFTEFWTPAPEEVHRVLRENCFSDRLEVAETTDPLGLECQRCGNIAGPYRPSVCPACGFRDISPCPNCRAEVPREEYEQLTQELYRCPRCQKKLQMSLVAPLVLANGEYNQPLVVTHLSWCDAIRGATTYCVPRQPAPGPNASPTTQKDPP